MLKSFSDSETESEMDSRVIRRPKKKSKTRKMIDTVLGAQVQQVEINSGFSKHLSSLASLVGVIHSEGKQTSQRVDVVESKLDEVAKDVVQLKDKVAGDKSSVWSLQDKFFEKLPLLFDTSSTGICGWVPVGFVDKNEVSQELVVISIPMMIWIYAQQGLDSAEIRSFFSSPSNFLRYPDKLGRADFLKVMLKTPFRPYAVGKENKPYSMAKNEERFVFTPLDEFRAVLKVCTDRFPPSSTGKMVYKTKIPERAGQQYALKVRSSISSSTGPVPELGGMELSAGEKKLVPSMEVRWWKDLLTPTVMKFLESGLGAPSVHVEADSFDDTVKRLASVIQAKLQRKRDAKAARNKRNKERKRLSEGRCTGSSLL